jgi:hypothetical protein
VPWQDSQVIGRVAGAAGVGGVGEKQQEGEPRFQEMTLTPAVKRNAEKYLSV